MALHTSIYDFIVPSISVGENIDFRNYKGKKILIVNTASECGFTSQYEGLEKLYQLKIDQNLVIIGFPSNDFGAQEPGSDDEIYQFCQLKFGVNFPLASKVNVIGENIAPIYQYLTDLAKQNGYIEPVKWNFTKILLDENGHFIELFAHSVEPFSDDLLKWLN